MVPERERFWYEWRKRKFRSAHRNHGLRRLQLLLHVSIHHQLVPHCRSRYLRSKSLQSSSVIALLPIANPLSRSQTYYYSGPGATKVAFGAFKRASTYSFGSIAFGSLIVAILDVLRAFFQILRSYENSEGNMIGAAIACVAQCCIGCIASLVEYFNR